MTDRPVDRNFENALTFHRQGRLAEAEAAYRMVLAADPSHAQSVLSLGSLCLQQGRLDEALDLTVRALESSPNSAQARVNLATVHQLSGRNEEAIAEFKKALGIEPEIVEAHYGLGFALQATGRLGEAIACYGRALSIDPDYAEANCARGNALQALGRYGEAIASYEAALDVDPDYAEAHANIAVALECLGRHTEAVERYERAVAIQPNLANVQAKLGTALVHLGRMAEARHAFQAAVALDPANPFYYFSLVNAGRMRPDDPHLAALEALAANADSLRVEGRICLDFALAKALSDVGDDERSFRHLIAGNALKRSQIAYDEASTLALFDRIQAVFYRQLMTEKAGNGDPSERPIFILGMPRSGSTLIEQILASHPKIFGGDELLIFRGAIGAVGADTADAPYPEPVPSMSGRHLRELATIFLDRLPQIPQVERTTDKTPENFLYAGLIHLAFPNARIIHTHRHPVNTCLSCFSKLFVESNQPFAYDLGELGRYYAAYERLMAHWRQVLPPGRIYDVQYEEFVVDFESQTRRLIAHCGLDWDDRCLKFHETARIVKTASAAQVREPIHRGSVGRWRPSEAILRPLLEGLGHEIEEPGNERAAP